jgi:hypothetical protein
VGGGKYILAEKEKGEKMKITMNKAVVAFVVFVLSLSPIMAIHLAPIKAEAPIQRYSDALVLVNSASPYVLDFVHYIKPYLNYFGIPYSTLDISTMDIPSDIEKHSLIIIGHKNFDPGHLYLSSTEEGYIVGAVNAGSGLINFDNALTQALATVQFSCADNAHQNPVYATFTNPSLLKQYDNDWDEFLWTDPQRAGMAGMFAFITEQPRVITFYTDVANGEYDVVACLYSNGTGSYYKYYYSFSNNVNPTDRFIEFTSTMADHAEFSLGTVTVSNGRFELYTNRGETTSSTKGYGWFWIRLIPRGVGAPLYDFVQQIFGFSYAESASTTAIQTVDRMIRINCWEDDHQSPVLVTTDQFSQCLPNDGEWNEFLWQQRGYPVVCAWTSETNILHYGMRFFTSGVPNGEYYVVANLYGKSAQGITYKYYYSINNGPEMHIDVTHDEMAELPLGTVTITDGNFQLYTRGADLLSGQDYSYAWGWIKLIPTTAERRHYIVSSQPVGNTITLYSQITTTGIVVHSPASTLLEVINGGGAHPLLIVTNCGQGRAVQWASYEFLDWGKLGYFIGLDDVFWRSFVWAARKPFAMQGMLPFVTLRVDDCTGPYEWIDYAYAHNFIPIAATFISSGDLEELSQRVQQKKAIACVHERTVSEWGNIDTPEEAAVYWQASDDFHYGHNIPYAKSFLAHFCETGTALMPGMHERGIEFIGAEIDIGMAWGQQFDYHPGPYMKYQHPASGRCHYLIADWAGDGTFFNLYVNPYAWFSEQNGDWLIGLSGQAAIDVGIQRIKRSLDSMAVGIYLTHEYVIDGLGFDNFGAVMAGIHDGIASYNPVYTDYDTMSRYVRAVVGTSDISSAVYDTSSGVISVTLTGSADIPTKFYLFTEGSGIQSTLVDVPPFVGTVTVRYPPAQTLTLTASPAGAVGGTFLATYQLNGVWHTNELHTTAWSTQVDFGTTATISSPQDTIDTDPSDGMRYSYVSGAGSTTMDSDKTITLNYQLQYQATFGQTGLGSDASGTVVTVDGSAKSFGDLPFSKWVASGSPVTYSYNGIVLSSAVGKRFKQVSVSGPASPITVTSPVTVTATYKIQYLLTVLTNPTGLSPQPTRNPTGEAGPAGSWWYDTTNVVLTAQTVTGYTFNYWDVDGVSRGLGVASITVNMNAAHTATAHYQAILPSASVPTATGTGTATFTPDAGYIDKLAAVSEATLPSTGKPNVAFLHGFFSFNVTGLPTTPPSYPKTVTITITLPSAVPIGTHWYKWHASVGWIGLPIGSDNGDNVITITITDNGIGDFDPTAGAILDPGGPGSPLPVGGVWVPINKFQLLAPWIGLASVITLAAVSIVYVKHRKKQQT